MRNKLFISVTMCIVIFACKKNNDSVVSNTSTQTTPQSTVKKHYAARDTTVYGTKFISMDIANKMLNSYLLSINSPQNDTDVRSLTVNADSLRAYLADTSIRNIKLMLAHTDSWATTNTGQYTGYQSGGFTVIIAAYDGVGNYVYYQGDNVLDYSAPCPYACATGGNASSFLLQ